jgi:hypothetical protein
VELQSLRQRLKFVFRERNQNKVDTSFGDTFGECFSESAGSASEKSSGTSVRKL